MHRHTQRWGSMERAPGWRNHTMPKAQQDYRVQLNMVGGGYCKQTNVEAGFRVYIWIKETGLANLGRSCLCRGAAFRPWMWEEGRKLCWALSAHPINNHAWTRGRLCHPRLSLILGKGTALPFLHGSVWGHGILSKTLPVSTKQSGPRSRLSPLLYNAVW